MSIKMANADLWHKRMGHPNEAVLEAARQSGGLGVEYRVTPSPCATCKINKSAQVTHLKTVNQEKERLELVYTDIIGPIRPQSIGGFQHAQRFSRQISKFRAVYFSRTKGEARDEFIKFNRDRAEPRELKIRRPRSKNRFPG